LMEVALDMPQLFAGVQVPIGKTRSFKDVGFGKTSFTLSRRQCACLLAHSFFGSLKKPTDVQLNNFRFTVVDLFMGTAVSPNSATTFLNYFTMLGKHGIPDGVLSFERQGYPKGPSPWQWEQNDKPLCQVDLVSGSIEDSVADVHAEFANAFIGGGVMTGDFAMEEILFIVKPELMVAMALQNMMSDTEAICISGAMKYSLTTGFKSSLEFAGDYDNRRTGPPPKVCAIDAIRGGGPAMTEVAMLRDMNKARIAFDGAQEVATGHWGCGAYGNHHDLMFLKQWLAASEAGVRKMYVYDFSKDQSHSIFPLVRKMKHMMVGQLWAFMREITQDLQPCKMAVFSTRIKDIAVGKLKVPGDEPSTAMGEDAPPLSQPQMAHATSGAGQPTRSILQRPSYKAEFKPTDSADPTKVGADGFADKAPEVPEDAAPPVSVTANASGPGTYYPLQVLQESCPEGVHSSQKEDYLSDADFILAFGMPRAEFAKCPNWKRQAAKKSAKIF